MVRIFGSSPLTRGKPTETRSWGRKSRLIPAHAGKTAGVRRADQGDGAHPRSRGENAILLGVPFTTAGSSPLTRGKPSSRCAAPLTVGLIPAHAGKTPQTHPGGRCSQAHPRSRGENVRGKRHLVTDSGSSPLTRGKQTERGDEVYTLRLIPAHAGKTDRAWRRGVHPQAHPRSRGENFTCLATTVVSSGSSPLTRGKPDQHGVVSPTVGLIPAHAGKTRAKTSSTSPSRAHPRSRGENVGLSRLSGGGRGSSPLTRGKRHSGDKGPRRRRLIPAHAGKTGCSTREPP